MRRQRRRPVHYRASCLNDGTVLAARPVRKPASRSIKRDHIKFDADGINESLTPGWELSNTREDSRFRFQDRIAESLNTRRAIRALVLPRLVEILDEFKSLRERLDLIVR